LAKKYNWQLQLYFLFHRTYAKIVSRKVYMNTAEWILVAILSMTLLVFLVVGIIFLVKFIHLLSEIEIMVQTGQSIAEKADDVADNIKDMTSVGPLAKSLVKDILTKKLMSFINPSKSRTPAKKTATKKTSK
jgi:hypothetical protein